MTKGIVIRRTVHYVLGDMDVKRIREQRSMYPCFHGNIPYVGDHVSMTIVNVMADEVNQEIIINGQCTLDGNDTLWVTSVKFDEKKSHISWHWIEKA